jgi:hypothetical protein
MPEIALPNSNTDRDSTPSDVEVYVIFVPDQRYTPMGSNRLLANIAKLPELGQSPSGAL